MLLHMGLFHSFLWIDSIPLCVYTHTHTHTHTPYTYTQSSVEVHLGCLHVLAIIINASLNVGMHVSFQIRVFSGYMLRSGIDDCMITLIFKGTSKLFSIGAEPINCIGGFSFLHILSSISYL